MRKIVYRVIFTVGQEEFRTTLKATTDGLTLDTKRADLINRISALIKESNGIVGVGYDVIDYYGYPFDDALITWIHGVIDDAYSESYGGYQHYGIA